MPMESASDYNQLLKLAVASPNLCSRQWVWEQYDHMVQSNTMVGPGSDAAVIRIKGTKKALAMTLDGPAYRVARNPREGAKLAVAEACRNIVCSGGRPLAATNCLNFGNPEHPEVMWQFSEVVDGMTRSLHCLRNADHRRQCQLLQRNLRRRHLSHAGPRHGWTDRRSFAWSRRPRFRDAGDSIVLVETVNRLVGKVESRRRAGASELCLRRDSRQAWSSPPTTSAKAAWPSPWPNAVIRTCIAARDRSAT